MRSRHCSLVVGALDSQSKDSSPALGCGGVSLGKALYGYFLTSPRCKRGASLVLGANPAIDRRPIKGGVYDSQSLNATETVISSGLMGFKGSETDFN